MCSEHQNSFPFLHGIHHDFNGEHEKNGTIRVFNKVLGKQGIYKADVEMEGLYIIGNSFFPQEWSPEFVFDKVMEAYDNFIRLPFRPSLDSNGMHQFRGYTNQGIGIAFLMSKENEIYVTYPVFEKDLNGME